MEIVISALSIVLVLGIAIVLLLRYATCCGRPRSLTAGDVLALETFKKLYAKLDIEIPERLLATKQVRIFGGLRRLTQLAAPVDSWGDMFEESCTGFLLDRAKKINGWLQAFEYAVWLRVGDWAEDLPVIAVAQEWREWTMRTLQKFARPDREAKAEVQLRLDWIERCRNICFTEVVELRETQFWCLPLDTCLLSTMRDQIRPILADAIGHWHTYELQESMGDQLRELFTSLLQAQQESLRVLEVILKTDEICIASKVLAMDGPPDFKPTSCFDKELLALCRKCYDLLHAGTDAEDDADHPKDGAGEHGTVVPVTSTNWLLTGRLPAPLTDLLQQVKLTDAEKATFERYKGELSRDSYGLSQVDFEELLIRYIVLHRDVENMAYCASIIRRLSRFASLGGELCLIKALDNLHMARVLALAKEIQTLCVASVEDLAAMAKKGWENMRAEDVQGSVWSSGAPIDNLRLGVAAVRIVTEGCAIGSDLVRDLMARADKMSVANISEELNQGVEAYMKEWDAFQEAIKHNADRDHHLASLIRSMSAKDPPPHAGPQQV